MTPVNNVAPVCFFTYNRVEETIKSISALRENFLALETDLYIFSDGPRSHKDLRSINKIRSFLKTITGFRSIQIFESDENKGLAISVIEGTSKIIKEFDKVIVLEDDLVTSRNFLDFMNQALDFYQNNKNVYSISGYTLDLPSLKNDFLKDYYFSLRMSSWGWGTWSDRWNGVDWNVESYKNFKYNLYSQYKFAKGGSDLPRMLRKQMLGRIDSWAIRFCYSQFIHNGATVYPAISKLESIGFGNEATHTKNEGRFKTEIDNSLNRDFEFHQKVIWNPRILKEFRLKFSLMSRIKNYLT